MEVSIVHAFAHNRELSLNQFKQMLLAWYIHANTHTHSQSETGEHIACNSNIISCTPSHLHHSVHYVEANSFVIKKTKVFTAHNKEICIRYIVYMSALSRMFVCVYVYVHFGPSSAYDKAIINLQALKHQVNRLFAGEGPICLSAMYYVVANVVGTHFNKTNSIQTELIIGVWDKISRRCAC